MGPRPNNGQRSGNRSFQNKKDENELNINEEITATQVRLVGENIPEPGIYSIGKAMALADELGLDLVEISAKADPPVCKILDYQKYIYQQKKKAKEMKANAAKVSITRLIHKICVIVSGLSIPKKGAIKLVNTAAKLIVNWKTINLQILL